MRSEPPDSGPPLNRLIYRIRTYESKQREIIPDSGRTLAKPAQSEPRLRLHKPTAWKNMFTNTRTHTHTPSVFVIWETAVEVDGDVTA